MPADVDSTEERDVPRHGVATPLGNEVGDRERERGGEGDEEGDRDEEERDALPNGPVLPTPPNRRFRLGRSVRNMPEAVRTGCDVEYGSRGRPRSGESRPVSACDPRGVELEEAWLLRDDNPAPLAIDADDVLIEEETMATVGGTYRERLRLTCLGEPDLFNPAEIASRRLHEEPVRVAELGGRVHDGLHAPMIPPPEPRKTGGD
jgi:hypothetical protein